MGDNVDHPEHYNQHPSGVECIDIVEEMPFNIGTAIKHLWRCDHKHPDPEEDLRKAAWYIQREIGRRARKALRSSGWSPATSATSFPPGSSVQRNEDGSTIVVAPEGESKGGE